MNLKLASLGIVGLSPFLFFLPQLRPSVATKSNEQIGKHGLLLDSENWKIKLNLGYCKFLDKFDYAKTTKFVVKCQDLSAPNSKELAFPAYALLFGDAISFWVELEKEEFKDDLIHFYSLYWSEKNKEKINKPITENCLFEGIYKNENSFCLINWQELNSSIKFIQKSKSIHLWEADIAELQTL